jgi:hypothetical protein
MKKPTPRSTPQPAIIAALLLLLSAGSAAAHSVQYLVTVNTSSLNTTPGFLDFQFFPGAPSSQLAMAQITHFTGGGGALIFNADSPQLNGDEAGTLPAAVSLVNDTPRNEYFQQFTYGVFFTFVLSLTGPALDSPNGTATSGSSFGVGLFDQVQNPVLTNDASGFAGEVLVNLDGSTTPHSFPTDTNGSSVVSFQVIPEPGTMFLLGFGSIGLMVLRRGRNR